MSAADGIQPSANISYRETRPGRVFRNYSIRMSQSNEWNHGWNRQTGLMQTAVSCPAYLTLPDTMAPLER